MNRMNRNMTFNEFITRIMTFNEFIAEIAENELIRYVEYRYDDMYREEKSYQEMDKYYERDYEIHLHYLIETWKNSIDEVFNNNFDYDYMGTYDELYDYYLESPCPTFETTWLDDIFERKILDTNVCLK